MTTIPTKQPLCAIRRKQHINRPLVGARAFQRECQRRLPHYSGVEVVDQQLILIHGRENRILNPLGVVGAKLDPRYVVHPGVEWCIELQPTAITVESHLLSTGGLGSAIKR